MKKVQTTLFDAPSGDVRGFVVGCMTYRGKQKRIAHAMLLVDKAPTITLEIPGKVSPDDVKEIMAVLTDFQAELVK